MAQKLKPKSVKMVFGVILFGVTVILIIKDVLLK